MPNLIKIAVDCMGGDDDATFVFPGLNRTLRNNNNLSFLLCFAFLMISTNF